MSAPLDRAQARRVFEETLQTTLQRYALAEDAIVEAHAPNEAGVSVVIARYKVHTDGRVECFQVLDEVLWPSP